MDTDDLLKQQEQQPLRKKRRLSYSDPDNDEASSESGSDERLSDNSDGGFQVDWSLEPHSRVSNKTTTQSPKLQATPPTPPAKSYTFSSLGISAPLQVALKSMSIKLPTEVQAACIPPLLEGKIKI
jgi:ATP-dependent RNA helicase DDX49/DBP8